ncbi:Elongation factor G [Dissostichus eleginoides]|uniref:Elongation factor G n=1 Tax=Dissostichus eleginoides TaxID=100907 RepID=A0AAD9B8K9_DISEL|nr:Elongation factor G [Dissostichus eleginoides]
MGSSATVPRQPPRGDRPGFSLVAVNKAFYCGVVSAIADTVSVQGVPVPGPNPQTNSKEGQGQPLLLLSLGIKAEELYLTLKLYSSRLHVGDSFFSSKR